MKRSFLFVAFCIYFFQGVSQNVGIGTTTPNVSAILDVTATDKGLLVPRVVLIHITSASPIVAPATGLLVWNTNPFLPGGGGAGFYYWDGSQWQQVLVGGVVWKINGNAGTNPINDFIGTTDNQPLNFRVNNLRVGKIDPILYNKLLG